MSEQYTQSTGLVDGEWHRMHKATPLLRGGIAIVFVAGVIIANLRERIVGFFLHQPNYDRGDPVTVIIRHNLVWPAIGIAVVVIGLCIAVFALSWRFQTFRVTTQAVEMRSGILRRQERKARLDRIQGINVHRPLLARVFGAAKLEIVVAGHDANLHLTYLASGVVERLRREILRLASGVQTRERAEAATGWSPEAVPPEAVPLQAVPPRAAELPEEGAPLDAVAPAHPMERPHPVAPLDAGAWRGSAAAPSEAPTPPAAEAFLSPVRRGGARGIIADRFDEFVSSPADLDPDAAPPKSVVHMHPLRLAGSLLLSGRTVFVLLIIAAMVVGAATGRIWLIVIILPTVLSFGGIYIRRFSKALRYSIAGSGHGVRIGFGLLATSSETIPPRRIHGVEALQPLMWRPFGWWQVRMNTAGHTHGKNSAGEARTTTLPVGNVSDLRRVLPLLLPGLGGEALESVIAAGTNWRSDQAAFSRAPIRARVLRPFSWRRTGYAIPDGVAVLRHGALVRRILFVPLARSQSVEISQGPARRMLGLAKAHLHLIDGPVHAKLPVMGRAQADELFASVSTGAIAWADAEAGSDGFGASFGGARPGGRVPPRGAPEHGAPEYRAPEHNTPEHSAPERSTPAQGAPQGNHEEP